MMFTPPVKDRRVTQIEQPRSFGQIPEKKKNNIHIIRLMGFRNPQRRVLYKGVILLGV